MYVDDGRHPTARLSGPCDICGEPDTGTPIQYGMGDTDWVHVSCLHREDQEQGW